jgi:thymidylate kinase
MLTEPHPHPAKRSAVEGIDGSGTFAQLTVLYRWLVARGFQVFREVGLDSIEP